MRYSSSVPAWAPGVSGAAVGASGLALGVSVGLGASGALAAGGVEPKPASSSSENDWRAGGVTWGAGWGAAGVLILSALLTPCGVGGVAAGLAGGGEAGMVRVRGAGCLPAFGVGFCP